jgi:3-hydroxybutyryl-CoA dehydrogenase
MEIGSVGIIGAGLMGSGIAEVCARNGIRTLITDAGPEQLAAGQRRVGASLDRGLKTGRCRSSRSRGRPGDRIG